MAPIVAVTSGGRGKSGASQYPDQNLINLYLRDYAQQNRKLSIEWRVSA